MKVRENSEKMGETKRKKQGEEKRKKKRKITSPRGET